MPDAHPILACRGLRRTFRMGESELHVLRGVDLDIAAGQFVAIEGRSGSGKSTLLHLLGALDAPDAGTVLLDGQDLGAMPAGRRAAVRNREVGFVFQFYHLLPELSVLQNTMLAAMVEHSTLGWLRGRGEVRRRATEMLDRFGLGGRLRHRPNQLSGGEQQRVAIARALMNRPRVLLADEPTGNLDAETGRQIMAVLEQLHAEQGQTIVMVTHDRQLARRADRVLVMRDGELVTEGG